MMRSNSIYDGLGKYRIAQLIEKVVGTIIAHDQFGFCVRICVRNFPKSRK